MGYDNYEERSKTYGPDALPKSITRKIYVHYRIAGSSAGQIEIWDCDLTGKDRILLHETMVTVKIPSKQDLKEKVVGALETEIEKIQAEAHMQVKELRERIESLLSIEYKPQSSAPILDETFNDLPF